MRKYAVAMLAIAVCTAPAGAQSVADTLVTLSTRMATMEGIDNTPHVVTRGDKEGGQLYVTDNTGQHYTVHLRTDSIGGNIDLYSRTSQHSAYFGTESDQSGMLALYSGTGKGSTVVLGTGKDSIGYLFINNGTGERRMIDLNAKGLFLMDDSGTKQLASFSRSLNGTAGQVFVNGTQVHDYAEAFEIAEHDGLRAGSVVAASADGKGIKLSSSAYDPAVVGVISGAGGFEPGMRIGTREDGSSNLPIAVSGQVYVRVSREAGAIAVGDLLVSSPVPGVAMRGTDKNRLLGTVVGKAIEPYTGQEEGLIRMLVMMR